MTHLDAAKLAATESPFLNQFSYLTKTPPPTLQSLADDAVALATAWMNDEQGSKDSAHERETAMRLAALVSDAAGLEFAVRFVDDVARPQDLRVAARELTKLGQTATGASSVLSRLDRGLLQLGARVARVLPRVVVPAARLRLRQLVGHLVADAGAGLAAHLSRTRAQSFKLNVNLLGEAVLGEDEARARLARTIALVQRPDVDYVSIKVSSVASQLVTWDLEGSRARVVERLLPLFRTAREHGVFLNLDMEEYRDLALTTAVFESLLSMAEFHSFEAGIVLQAYLPDALSALQRLAAFASARAAKGGAPIKVRIVKGANLAMEHVEAELHDWPLAPYDNKPDVDANYVRMMDFALRPGVHDGLRIGVASHNLYHVALAILAARARDVTDALDIEMLQGMAPDKARAVRDEMAKHGGRVVLYTPVVAASDFDVAIAYLVRRLEENAAEQNFLYAMFAPDEDADRGATTATGTRAMRSQQEAFMRSVSQGACSPPAAVTPRRGPRKPLDAQRFRNTPDTDPAVAAHRAWAMGIVSSPPARLLPRTEQLTSTEAVDAVVASALHAQESWSQVPTAERARVLRAVARQLDAARTELVRVMVHEAGKTVAEADPEVSEAIDFANYYAESALALDQVPGATFTPAGVTLITPPWNFPVAIAVGGVLSALAAGSVAIAKPPPPTPRCLEVAMEAIHRALVECDVDPLIAQYVRVPDDELGQHLVTHAGVARILLTGAIETAQLFAGWKPERPVIAETSGKNALIVTPSADLDLAVADLVRSAFGHAGQKCSAASLVILVGSVGNPKAATGSRFRRQLVDAVRSLAVGPATEIASVMGPLTEPAQGKLLHALTTTEGRERWLVQPQRLGPDGKRWSAGLKDGVEPGSDFHHTECFGPVLGIMTAKTLDDAIELQNAVRFGLTGGIHTLDRGEIEHWLERVQVGNAYVNRPITGAIVQRQPFGGWKASSVGPGAKAGGPNYVAQLGAWSDDPAVVPSRVDAPDAWLAWANADDERWWASEFGITHDPTGLAAESNDFRYVPVDDLTIRVGRGALPIELERVLGAARVAGVGPVLSYAEGPQAVRDDVFAARVQGGHVTGRVRVIGVAPGLLEAAASQVGVVNVLSQPVVASGRRELLCMLREQAVSRTRHRYGHLHARDSAIHLPVEA
ncbi:MAG: bifunctional proline dehydrogenase/L-glutamate gamma-semialdehyde dehydrogenase [Sandaracinaceae bacterium]|nr:bifunctional proline dehydrogenase/L-glutamate gamma-semialdehyde dehydrogenase [Sandaracinaceae bacterium]